MQDIREYHANLHSVAPSRYSSRAGASDLYHSSSPTSQEQAAFGDHHNHDPGHNHDHDDDEQDEPEPSLAGSPPQSSDPDSAVFEEPASQQSSPGTSHPSGDDDDDEDDDEMSEFPSDLHWRDDHGGNDCDGKQQQHHQQQQQNFPPYSTSTSTSAYPPHKMRSPFRNPSSVRAMQMDTTPPHLTSPFSQQQQQPQQRYHHISSPSRNGTTTPRSTRSSHSHSAAMRSPPPPSRLSAVEKLNLKKEYPLVLLHVTLLPIPMPFPYSTAVMESVLPPHILENWKLLRQKATTTVLDRGILIPHPREDYDLLEERLLESLELKAPRILKCGHFRLGPEEEADLAAAAAAAAEDEAEAEEGEEGEEDADDADICEDCGRRIRDGRFGGSGTGSKRWDIKIFAANGLMRAGAWGAAWREMERVDIEIVPWMDDRLKRLLELRHAEGDEDGDGDEVDSVNASGSHAAVATAAAGARFPEKERREEGENGEEEIMPLPLPHHHHQHSHHSSHHPPPPGDPANERSREIYGTSIPSIYNLNPSSPSFSPQPQLQPQIPLKILLRNYVHRRLARARYHDIRTILIAILSFLVVLLALRIAVLSPLPLLPTTALTPSPVEGLSLTPASASGTGTGTGMGAGEGTEEVEWRLGQGPGSDHVVTF